MSPIDKAMLLPKWTKRVVTDLGGRDPLGLSRISQTITDYLLTGIITTTDRARYYSFYCWALWHIQIEESPSKYQDFVDAFRRREAAIAIATVLNNETTSPVGVLAVKPKIEEGRSIGEFETDFKVLPSNQLGGYGQYYGGSIYQLGLTYRLEDGLDLVTEGRAESLAKAFHKSIINTSYIQKRLFVERSIQSEDMEASKQFLSIDALLETFCTDEREILVEIFFSFQDNPTDERALLRRYTLAQILYVISEYEKHGYPALVDDIEGYLVYPIYYYGVFLLDDSVSQSYKCPDKFQVCHSLWKQFCLQEYVTQAIESLMYSVLEIVDTENGGLLIDELIARLMGQDFFCLLEEVTGSQCDQPWQLLAAFGIDKIPDENVSKTLQYKFSITNKQSEEAILKTEGESPGTALAISMLLFSCLYGKWRGIENDTGWAYVALHARNDLWIGSIFQYLDVWLKQETTWTETLKVLIESLIINQHDKIMYEKRRLDSCWLTHIEGRIIKEQDYGPRPRSSRHKNAVSILYDLGLLTIDLDTRIISLTSNGKEILKKVLVK
jgi:hypothetical protein